MHHILIIFAPISPLTPPTLTPRPYAPLVCPPLICALHRLLDVEPSSGVWPDLPGAIPSRKLTLPSPEASVRDRAHEALSTEPELLTRYTVRHSRGKYFIGRNFSVSLCHLIF